MRNIELKCRCTDLEAVLESALRLGARESGVLDQTDIFFRAPQARLKLRLFGDGTGEVIAYRRPDQPGARGSDYEIYPTTEPDALRRVLEAALEQEGIVRKQRRLLLYRHTRIHLDMVEGLGTFVELETVIRDPSEAEARAELAEIAAALGLDAQNTLRGAYLDLLHTTE
jgi:predicted adenylyl cyclase CyaB